MLNTYFLAFTPECPEGYLQEGHYCYHFEPEELPFEDAQARCWEKGGELMAIISAEDTEFIKMQDALKGFKGYYWIGYTDVKVDGKILVS